MTTVTSQPGPEILTVGPDGPGRLSRRGVLALLLAVLALIAGLALWRFVPHRAPLFSLSDLQGVYAGWASDASVIDRRRVQEEPGDIVPAACEPLFEATVLNRVPQEALDGVSTFWAPERSAVSLFSYRFADVASANREYLRLAHAFDTCRNVQVEIRARPAGMGLLTGIQQDPASDAPEELGYVLTTTKGTALVVQVLPFSNTVSWQFRYEPVAEAYLPLTGQRVMDGLADQLHSVQQDLHR